MPAGDTAAAEPGGQLTLRLFRIFGIQFTANWSWIFMLALLVYVAATTFGGLLLGVRPLVLWLLAAVAVAGAGRPGGGAGSAVRGRVRALPEPRQRAERAVADHDRLVHVRRRG